MRFLKYMLASVVMTAALTVSAAKPTLDIEPKVHNFGVINENGGSVTAEFTLTNTGDKPIIIKDAKASCGCTRPSYPKAPIRPGETTTLKVAYSPAGRPGEFDKTITIRSNAKNSKVTVRITGTVIPEEP